LKLRQLSFLTVANNPKNLTYANLLRELGLETPRELEDLVISAIYAGLVSGTLDPYNQVVCLSSVSPLRDLPPNSIPSMLSTLSAWSSRCVSTLTELEKQIATVKADALKRHRDEQEWAITVEKLVGGKTLDKGQNQRQSSQGDIFSHLNRKLGAGAASKRGNGGLDRDDSDDMDVDDDDEESFEQRGLRSSKKRGFSNLSFGK
jgi:COP9 signalosome complex subunit 7